jgi:hypothetical protein
VKRLACAAVLAVLILALIGSTACAKLHARGQPSPPLDTPPPPARAIVPIESEPTVNTEPPAVEAPSAEAPARRPTRTAARAAPPSPVKAEPAPAASSSQPKEEPEPPRPLQTTANATEQKVRALLAGAGRDLGRIDYRTLSVDATAQYDIAKRFIEQAEEALKVKNLVFAGQLADKAAALAVQLVRR